MKSRVTPNTRGREATIRVPEAARQTRPMSGSPRSRVCPSPCLPIAAHYSLAAFRGSYRVSRAVSHALTSGHSSFKTL